MKNVFSYIVNLTKKDARESSKRFLALYVTIVLISFVVFVYTDKNNIELVLGELISFALVLSGVAAWEKRNKEKYK